MRLRLTRGGWGCLALSAALMAAGYNSDLNLLYLMGSTVVAALLVSAVMASRAVWRVRARRELPDEVFASAPFVVRLVLERKKRKRAGVTVEEKIEGPSGDHAFFCLCDDVSAGPGDGSSYLAEVPHRGEHRFTSQRIESRFPFGLVAALRRLDTAGKFIVYPRMGRLLRPVPGAANPGPSLRALAHREQEIEFRSLRDFRQGDSPRLIHWRTSAKRGELKVRELEGPIAADHVTLLLDTRLPDNPGQAELARFEAGVSFAATLVEHFTSHGRSVSLIAGGQATPPTLNRRILLHRLAMVDVNGGEHFEDIHHGTLGGSSFLVAIVSDRARAQDLPPELNARLYVPGEPEFDAVFSLEPASEEGRE